MDIKIKDLLINFLFILLALFLVQMIYMIQYASRLKDLKGWVIIIFPVISLVLCMLSPFSVNQGFFWDLRWIPFILGGLYGGYKLGFFLLFLVLTIRYYQGGGGFYLVLVSFTIIGLISMFLSKYYLQLSIKQKVIVSTLLNVIGLLITMFLAYNIFFIIIPIADWLQFIAIHLIGMVISTLLWEVIRTNFHVLQKLIKAEKLQLVSHLAASISHEVRNPLTAARGFIQLLSDDISAEKRKEYADITLLELDRATDVINDYLTFAKPALEKEEKINVNEEIHYAVNVITPLATMHGIQIKLFLLENHYFTKGESKRIQQCLINIFKNGIESMPDKGTLQIYQSYSDGMIKINIQDEGKGMTQEQMDRLGEPYFTT